MTVRDFADQSGASASNLRLTGSWSYKIEQGARLPSLKLVRILAAIIEVDPMEVEEFKVAIDNAARV